ncbi:ABC transporter substrate-binding protein [Marinobacterium nitratireducens]|uniref:ABC transporter substrate-binding protein n=1 Tax=Marinobacterium nitratireducens TaxID=518897 RepID=A0A918DXN6_9GAMM|nr:TRAP transporter substrate-binding protein [Marinobacterium nitratireducens]GGO86872.1 ABC transporter substrate-binding protein [Marinobacterium nitratireducens]
MKKTILTTLLATGLMATGAQADEAIELKVLGQPSATGLIMQEKEKPFFETLAERTGLPLAVNFKPLDSTGIKDVEELRTLKSGLFDVVSLRFSQVSRDEPTILGLDLVGMNPTYEAGRETVDAFGSVVDARLQERFNTKLLGVWPFGPQVLFCNAPIEKLADIKGLKVRVYDQNLAAVVESAGGIPVPLSFGEVHQSLALGVVDCAITGPSSANSAGWPEVTTHVLPLAFQMAINGYGINLDTWNRLSVTQQKTLETAFAELTDDIWEYSEELFEDAKRCNVGESPCDYNKSFNLTEVPVTEQDIAMVRDAVREISYPTWAEICDKSNPECSSQWRAALGEKLGF